MGLRSDLYLAQLRKSLSFLERQGWCVVAASSVSLTSAGSGEGSLTALRRLSPQKPLNSCRRLYYFGMLPEAFVGAPESASCARKTAKKP